MVHTFWGVGVTILGLLLLTLALDFTVVILVAHYPLEDAGSHCAPKVIWKDTKASLPLPTQSGEAAGQATWVSLPPSPGASTLFPNYSPTCPHPVPTAPPSSHRSLLLLFSLLSLPHNPSET